MKNHSWAQCPPELLEQVFAHLTFQDILSASGVSFFWYNIANNILQKEDKWVYRWPAMFPKKDKRFICIIGTKRIEDLVHYCKDIEFLHLKADGVDTISAGSLKHIFRNESSLKSLTIDRYTINKSLIITLLSNAYLWSLKIIVENPDDLHHEAFKLLKENREIFSQLCIEFVQNDKIKLYYPSPHTNLAISKLSAKTISIDCTGFGSINIEHNEELSLKNAFNIATEDLVKISRLNIRKLKITHSDIEEQDWDMIFSKGFKSVENLILLNCPHFSKLFLEKLDKLKFLETDVSCEEDIRQIVKIYRLRSLKLHLPISLIDCFLLEIKSHKMETMKLVIDCFNSNITGVLLEKRISQMAKNLNVQFKLSKTGYKFKSEFHVFLEK